MKQGYTTWLMNQPLEYLQQLYQSWAMIEPPLVDVDPREMRNFVAKGSITNDELISLAQHLWHK